MEIKTAGELMIALDKYPHIPHRHTLRQAIAEFQKWEIEIQGRRSLPRVVLIFDDNNQLMGMVRRRDILRGLEPTFLSGARSEISRKLFDVKVDPNIAEFSYEKFLKHMKDHAERPVEEIMLPIISTVDYKDHIMKVISELVGQNVSLLPVLKDGKVVGVVRSVDVFQEISNYLL